MTLKSHQLPARGYSKRRGGSIKEGYWYDGGDCFVYGTIITGDDGTQLFVPADTATQYLMNVCGWSNVA